MAFHGVLVLRDEADMIAELLGHLLTWVDSLGVYDTGSTDGTWEFVQAAAARDRRVIVLGHETVPYDNGLRAMAFERARSRYRNGDWVARLDADEFYHVPPPRFVEERLARGHGRLFAQMYDFLITHEEARAWDEGRESLADRARPIESRRRRYLVQEFPEPRLFRYRRTMRWPATSYVPLCGGPVARARIPVRHYRWRDPVQAAARCALRSAARARGIMVGDHWAVEDWRDWLADERDPLLLTHTPGAALPDPALSNHLPRGIRAAAQRVLHHSGAVGLVDRLLPGFDPAWKPAHRRPHAAR
jgi:hypothetical protein